MGSTEISETTLNHQAELEQEHIPVYKETEDNDNV